MNVVPFPITASVTPKCSDPVDLAPHIAFDVETTGLYPEHGARLTEAAIVGASGTLWHWEDYGGSEVDGLRSCVRWLNERLEHAVLVGHNIKFDLEFLAARGEREGVASPCVRCVDTLGLARRLVENCSDFRLQALAARFHLEPMGPLHRAVVDARLALDLFGALVARYDLKTLGDAGLQQWRHHV